MKLRHLTLVAVIAIALVACKSERSSMTGSYGGGLLSGQVSITGGGSPAGVEVSIRGTGMTTVLTDEGRFTFASVPERADLDFRRADGLAGSLRLEEGETSLHVELGPNGAKKSSRRRAARGGEKVYEFEGLVRGATDTEVVVFTSKQVDVTIGLTPETIIRKGNQILTAADLVPDTRVHVKAKKTDETYTAVLVIVQNQEDGEDDGEGEEPKARKEFEGTVISAAADQLVIFDSHKEEVTFVIDAQTIIRKGNTPIAAADIQAGWRVHVKATTADDGTKTATQVIVQRNK